MAKLTKDDWTKVEALFADAVELDPADRGTYLDERCERGSAIRLEVDRLLAADRNALPFLDGDVADIAAPLLPNLVGTRVGPWLLTDEIGRGGMGVVYRAARAEAEFEQVAAIKLVKRGLDTAEVLERFVHERRVLASLKHPHIARLIDGGVSTDSQPWFAMEYIEGVPISDYCRENKLSLDDRLSLFIDVCRAVAYAHDRNVVHRDLKPSNVLVTSEGEPQLMDFGLAKVLRADADGAHDVAVSTTPALTMEDGQRWLTLEYASPEQIHGKEISPASDTYQLGLILYRLLTGQGPYKIEGLSRLEAITVLCDSPPARPGAEVDRDLETILMKALRKDPSRRYRDAFELADDIERYLAGLPVRARRDTMLYRAHKFVTRHRQAVASAAVLVTLAVAYIVTVTIQNGRIEAERDRARYEADRAEEIVGYLTGLFEANDPAVAQGDALTVRELLDRGVERAASLDAYPTLQATLLRVTGGIYFSLDDLETSETLHREALDRLASSSDAEAERERVHAMLGLSGALLRQDRWAEADSILTTVIHRLEAAPFDRESDGDRLLKTAQLYRYNVLHALGRNDEAEEVFAAFSAPTTPGTPAAANNERNASEFGGSRLRVDAANVMVQRARVLGIRGQMRGDQDALMQAMELLQRAVVLLRAELGPRHPRVGDALNSLAGNAMMRVKLAPEAADSTTAEALAVNRAIYIEPHVGTWTAVYARAEFLNRMGSTAEAEPLAREAVDLARAISGRGSADRDGVEVDQSSGIDEGFGVGENARASNVASTGASAEASNTLLWTSNNLLGRILYSQERFAEAVQVQRPTYEHWRRSFGPEYMVTLIAEVVLAESLAGLGRHDEAESMMLHAYTAFESTRGRNDLHTRSAANSLSLFYEARGRMSDASRYRELSEASK